MAWDVANLQSQVQLATGDDGVANLIIDWANRTQMEIATAAFWGKAIAHDAFNAIAGGNNDIDSAWDQYQGTNIVNIHRVIIQGNNSVTDYKNPAVQLDIRDLYAQFHGEEATHSGTIVEHYAVAKWSLNSDQICPELAWFPNPSGTVDYEVHYLQAPDKFTASTDTNWILTRYFHIMLCGTLRRAFLYKGNVSRYQVELAGFKNGLTDMLRQEMGPIANTPVLRALVDSQIQNLVRG